MYICLDVYGYMGAIWAVSEPACIYIYIYIYKNAAQNCKSGNCRAFCPCISTHIRPPYEMHSMIWLRGYKRKTHPKTARKQKTQNLSFQTMNVELENAGSVLRKSVPQVTALTVLMLLNKRNQSLLFKKPQDGQGGHLPWPLSLSTSWATCDPETHDPEARDPETHDLEACDLETRDLATCDLKTHDPKEVGVQEARSRRGKSPRGKRRRGKSPRGERPRGKSPRRKRPIIHVQ